MKTTWRIVGAALPSVAAGADPAYTTLAKTLFGEEVSNFSRIFLQDEKDQRTGKPAWYSKLLHRVMNITVVQWYCWVLYTFQSISAMHYGILHRFRNIRAVRCCLQFRFWNIRAVQCCLQLRFWNTRAVRCCLQLRFWTISAAQILEKSKYYNILVQDVALQVHLFKNCLI